MFKSFRLILVCLFGCLNWAATLMADLPAKYDSSQIDGLPPVTVTLNSSATFEPNDREARYQEGHPCDSKTCQRGSRWSGYCYLGLNEFYGYPAGAIINPNSVPVTFEFDKFFFDTFGNQILILVRGSKSIGFVGCYKLHTYAELKRAFGSHVTLDLATPKILEP